MKTSPLWKNLTFGQRQVWKLWARKNPVMLENGNAVRMNALKAFTMVLQRRAIAGESANATVPPAAPTWLNGALSLRDSGPFTTNDGYIGFRADQNIAVATKWFVWATPPVDGEWVKIHSLLRFITCMGVGVVAINTITGNLGGYYALVHGSWDGPGSDGEWPANKYIWFRLHQYFDGQLGPGVLMRGRIQVEL